MKSIRGIDVSKHQGNIDWKKVKESGIEFAILRLGFARRLDSKFLRNVEGCLDNGIKIPAIYNFSYALNANDAKLEAEFVVNTLKDAGLTDTIVFFDLEYDSVRYAKENNVVLGYDECNLFTKTFCDRVIELGYPAGVYFNMHYYRKMYDPKLLDNYEKWLAHWTSGKPALDIVYHQFSDQGKVPGIYGNVDMNYIYVKEDEKPETPEVKSMDDLIVEVMTGKWGNGEDRKQRLKEAGHDPKRIQNSVNKMHKVVKDCMKGLYGNGEDRKKAIKNIGMSYDHVQAIINHMYERQNR